MLAALVIVFREIIEAGLVVGIVLAATRGVPRRGLWVGYGILGGIAGACLVAAFASSISAAMQGARQELFNVSILLIAVLMLAWIVAGVISLPGVPARSIGGSPRRTAGITRP
jgi:high-affinity iron transporter